jgi:hypothetical protein
MADRILVWFSPNGDFQGPEYYLEDDYVPADLRIMVKNPPVSGDLEIDITADDSTIFREDTIFDFKTELADGQIEYHTLAVSTFSKEELITGGTSGAKGYVVSDNGIGSMTLKHSTPGTNFSAAETITGSTSGATAIVDAFVKPVDRRVKISGTPQGKESLEQGDLLNDEANDFKDQVLAEGTIIKCFTLRSGGANGITVQLELNKVAEEPL